MPGVELRLAMGGPVDGYDSYEDAVANASSTPLEDRVAGRDMLYSSGTTGRPKGVLPAAEPRPLEDGDASVAMLGTMLFGFSETSRYLSPAPLYHAAPLRFCLGIHITGGTVVVMERFDPEEYLRLIQEHSITISQVVPTMFVRMLKLDDEVRTSFDVSSLTACILSLIHI